MPELAAQEAASTGPAPIAADRSLVRKALRNSASQVVGRLAIAATRLATAAVIARQYGKSVFAEYSLLFGIMTIAEWLLDFGTLDIFVREVCREPLRTVHLIRTAAATKIIQIPVAFAVLMAVLVGMQYPHSVVRAGLLAGLSLLFYAGVLTCRIAFRAHLAMERDALAEFFSVVVMVPVILLPSVRAGGLMGLAGAYLLSRVVFFGLAWWFSAGDFRFSVSGVAWPEVRFGLTTSFAIGAAGFVVVIYEALDVLLLARLSGVGQVAFYSGAQRFVWPVLMAQAAISATVYPIAVSCWAHARGKFAAVCQRGVDSVLLVAGFSVCALVAGSGFLMRVLGHDLANAAPVLRILALLCFAKALASTMGPLLYIVGKQRQVLNVVFIAVVAKAAIVAATASSFGYIGVAWGVVITDVCFATLPLLFLVRRHTGYAVSWVTPLKIFGCTACAAFSARWIFKDASLGAAVAAPVIFAGLALITGAVRISDIRLMLNKQSSAGAGESLPQVT
jgi:O-antigen/teichoic acid export membrane protein